MNPFFFLHFCGFYEEPFSELESIFDLIVRGDNGLGFLIFLFCFFYGLDGSC